MPSERRDHSFTFLPDFFVREQGKTGASLSFFVFFFVILAVEQGKAIHCE